tara:strand:- start:54 stop:176 length:123 start_codon:yes stop_codon:yes gene_type:complete
MIDELIDFRKEYGIIGVLIVGGLFIFCGWWYIGQLIKAFS